MLYVLDEIYQILRTRKCLELLQIFIIIIASRVVKR
jgi:hypothetical protein